MSMLQHYTALSAAHLRTLYTTNCHCTATYRVRDYNTIDCIADNKLHFRTITDNVSETAPERIYEWGQKMREAPAAIFCDRPQFFANSLVPLQVEGHNKNRVGTVNRLWVCRPICPYCLPGHSSGRRHY